MAVIRDFINGAFADDQQEEVGIDGFVTAARVREVTSKSRSAPTTFLEDGSHNNDHIIRNPLTISIAGNISDVFVKPQPAIAALQSAQANIGVITQYLPSRTQTQISKVAALSSDITGAIIANGQQVAGYLGFTGNDGKTNIEKFIDLIDSIHNSDALIKIDMPFRTYENMCITSVEYERDNTSQSLSFTLEAQQFRFSTLLFSEVANNPATSTNGQTEDETDKGAQEGEPVTESLGTQLKDFIGGFFEE